MDIRKEIIDILQKDAKIENKTLAAMLGISPELAAEHVRALEEEGVIMGYGAIINTEILGESAPAEAFIELKVAPERDFGYDDIARRVYKFSEVKALYLNSGRCDLIVRIEAKTMKDISRFVWEKLSVLEGVTGTETLFIMRKYKEYGEVLINDEKEARLVVSP
ncbi:MAG: Lrp/AsnC family transcriptional regulator [Clostridia bacterium]|nr:Lrp/AsnC family transcriptional regulator [Clostridia bacterium]